MTLSIIITAWDFAWALVSCVILRREEEIKHRIFFFFYVIEQFLMYSSDLWQLN